MMNATDILRTTRHSDLFGCTEPEIRKQFRALASKWHPDICKDPKAGEVMAHLSFLRERAMQAITGKNPKPSLAQVVLRRQDGSELLLRALRERRMDFGRSIIASRTVSTIWDADYADLAEREIVAVRAFSFANGEMEKQMRRFLPRMVKDEQLDGGQRLTVIERGSSDIVLQDLLDAKGVMPAEHAAWLCSGLLNICCWMAWAGIAHGAVSPESITLDPTTHDVKLTSGWAFSSKFGTRPAMLPGRTISIIPRLASPGQFVDASVDLRLVRQTIREALGDPSGSRMSDMGVPKPLVQWLNLPGALSAIEDYKAWGRVLHDAWGKRKFVHFDLAAQDIYGG